MIENEMNEAAEKGMEPEVTISEEPVVAEVTTEETTDMPAAVAETTENENAEFAALLETDPVWDRLVEQMEAGEIIEAPVTEIVKGGLVVDIGKRGFVPGSMVEEHFVADFAPYQDQILTLKIMEMDAEKNRIILSHKEVVLAEKAEKQAAILAQLPVGEIIEGTIVRLTDFGAFVSIGEVEGLVHVSQIAHNRIQHPKEALTVGKKTPVKILNVDSEKGRVALSIKEATPGPWEEHAEQMKPTTVMEGKVVRLTDFGAFVELFPGIEGLVHISQIAHQHIKTPHEVLHEGETVQVKILSVDTKKKKVSLSIKELLENPDADIPYELPEKETGFSLGELFAEQLKGFK